MKTVMFSALFAAAILVSGCVTEGARPVEPASDEEQAEVNLALGVSYIEQQRPDLAIEPLLRAIDLQPRFAEAHSMIAIAYDQEGSSDLAENHHLRATELAPRNAIVQNSYAVFLCIRGRWDDAGPYYDRAISASDDASSVTAMINAATCARSGGDIAAAENYFRAVLGINPINAEALRGMMDVSIRSANFISGRAFWQRLERAAPVLPEDLLSCYVIESELGDDSAAQGCADRLRREFPGSPAVPQLLELERNAG